MFQTTSQIIKQSLNHHTFVDYHLVMTNSLPWKITIFLIGKPSISMGHFPWHTVSHNHGFNCPKPPAWVSNELHLHIDGFALRQLRIRLPRKKRRRERAEAMQ